MGRTMKPHKISLVCAITLIISISISNFQSTNASGFSIDLIHRDSLQSDELSLESSSSSSSSYENVRSAVQRSFNRAQTLTGAYSSRQVSAASPDIIADQGEYLLRFYLGTPKVETLAIADTGSDLTWIQCLPCTKCFKQTAPIFNPKSSSSYKPLTCSGSGMCNSLEGTSCNLATRKCTYTMSYGDRSFSKGDVATETITLGSTAGKTMTIPNVIMGCGHNDQGTFGVGAAGIVGLGGGKESLIRQMGSSIGGKFSYCLVPFSGGASRKSTSKMHFGDEAVVSGAGVATTPIVPKYPDTYYYLTLDGVSVGGKQRFNLEETSSSGEFMSGQKAGRQAAGNIIIDSGTTLTMLPSDIYSQVEGAVREQMTLKPISDPAEMLDLCYQFTGDADLSKIPEITMHFRGADVKLKPYNTFIRTSEESLCFAFVSSPSLAIYGNVAQMNFLVGYDTVKKTVSFKPTDCSSTA